MEIKKRQSREEGQDRAMGYPAPAINIKQFSFCYGSREILHEINMSVNVGEYVSIIGPNGAGKSTVLKCINRIVKGGQGTIELFGRPLASYSQKQLGSLIGYVPQSREQPSVYTVEEFVMMGRYPHLQAFAPSQKEDERIVREALCLTGLQDLSCRLMRHLSGGERQKVYLAAALAQQPKILLLDEPTTHLDPKHHIEIQKIISDICSQGGMTVLHVTHDLSYIYYWSQKIVAIKDGRVHSSGLPRDVMKSENLYQIFDAPFLRIPHPVAKHDIIIPEVHA